MSRKLSLAVVGCTALVALGGLPSSALAHPADDIVPACATNDLPSGIYPPSNPTPGARGTFTLTFSPGARQPAEVDGGALLCGAHNDNRGNNTGFFYQNAIVTITGLGQNGLKVKCGRPNPPVAYCDLNNNGQIDPNENVADGTYNGSGDTLLWCDDPLCGDGTMVTGTTENHFRYDETDCVDSSTRIALACQKAEATIIFGIGCKANVTTYATVGDPKSIEYKIAGPKCRLIGDVGPVYVGTINNFHVCKYYGSGNRCGTDPNNWLFLNGTGAWRAQASAVLEQVTEGGPPASCNPGPGGRGRICTNQRAINGAVASGTW